MSQQQREIPVLLYNGEISKAVATGNNACWNCSCFRELPLIGKSGLAKGFSDNTIVECPNCYAQYYVKPDLGDHKRAIEVVQLPILDEKYLLEGINILNVFEKVHLETFRFKLPFFWSFDFYALYQELDGIYSKLILLKQSIEELEKIGIKAVTVYLNYLTILNEAIENLLHIIEMLWFKSEKKEIYTWKQYNSDCDFYENSRKKLTFAGLELNNYVPSKIRI